MPTDHTIAELRSRRLQALLVVLALLSGLTSLVLFAGPGLAATEERDQIHVSGTGSTVFLDVPDPGSSTPACSFAVESLGAGTATGSFSCSLGTEAQALGIPFVSVDAVVTSLRQGSDALATAHGRATLTAADGTQTQDVSARVRFKAGAKDVGEIGLKLVGIFDGQPGDTRPDDGDYTLWSQTVGEGEIVIETVTPSPSPTDTPSPSPTDPSPTPTTTPTPTIPPSPSPSSSPTSPIPSPPAGVGGSGGGTGSTGPLVPAPSGSMSSASLLATLSELAGTDPPPLSSILAVVGPFPVAGLSWWHDDWHAYRCCPYPHLHEGLDMFAAGGTPVVSAADGTLVEKGSNPVSGLAVEVQDAQGTRYFYAHLSGYAANLQLGQRVFVGQVLGYVGNTGDAAGGPTHLHFQVMPGGVPVPPMPYVDRWLQTSEIRATALLSLSHRTVTTSDLADWQRRALLLAGLGQSATLQREGVGGTPIAARRSARSTGSPRVAAGAMMAFMSGAFLLLLVGPGVVRARRGDPADARRPGRARR